MKAGPSDVAARFFAAATRAAPGRRNPQQRSKTFTRSISTRRSAGLSAAAASSCATNATDHKKAQSVLVFTCASLWLLKSARYGRHTGRKSQEEPSVMVVAILAAIRLTSGL